MELNADEAATAAAAAAHAGGRIVSANDCNHREKGITDNESDLCNTSILLHFAYTNDLFR